MKTPDPTRRGKTDEELDAIWAARGWPLDTSDDAYRLAQSRAVLDSVTRRAA